MFSRPTPPLRACCGAYVPLTPFPAIVLWPCLLAPSLLVPLLTRPFPSHVDQRRSQPTGKAHFKRPFSMKLPGCSRSPLSASVFACLLLVAAQVPHEKENWTVPQPLPSTPSLQRRDNLSPLPPSCWCRLRGRTWGHLVQLQLGRTRPTPHRTWFAGGMQGRVEN